MGQATSWVFDYNDDCGDIFRTDQETGDVKIIWKEPLIVPFTYVGGHAPKP